MRRSREREGKSSILTQQYQDKLFNKQQQQEKSQQQQQQQVEEEEEEEDTTMKEDGEDELLERVAQKWEEKIGRSTNTDDIHFVKDMDEKERQYNQLYGYKGDETNEDNETNNDLNKPTTTGVGGTWTKTQDVGEIYKPSRGSWGAFPRPKDISKAYGGGRRVDPIISEENLKKSEEETREKLRAYREKVGIVVESELQHADQIEEALTLANRAMLVR